VRQKEKYRQTIFVRKLGEFLYIISQSGCELGQLTPKEKHLRRFIEKSQNVGYDK